MPLTSAAPLQLKAADGYPLAATHFPANGPSWIVVGSATAVPRGFYRRFAEYAQAQGVQVLTLDYRGIGGSAPKSLRGFAPDYLDWARLDLAAAVDHASARGPTWLVGHSYGGHAVGLLPKPEQLRGAYACASGAGWHGYMPWRERIKVWLLWHAVGPLAVPVLGYQPLKAMGLGENLPASVYRQWKRWCNLPHYFFDDPQAAHVIAGFDRVRLPIAAANALDDDWALPASRDAFFEGYRNAPVDRINLDPQALGLTAIGHMGYFREPVGRILWPLMFDWLRAKGLILDEPRP